jgi:hypothetical protein
MSSENLTGTFVGSVSAPSVSFEQALKRISNTGKKSQREWRLPNLIVLSISLILLLLMIVLDFKVLNRKTSNAAKIGK